MSLESIFILLAVKFFIITLIYLFIHKKNKQTSEKSSEAAERMLIREYGRKINSETRSKKSS